MDVRAFSIFFSLLTIAADAFVVSVLVAALLARRSPAVARRTARWRAWLAPAALPLAWVVAATATFGSLYYSEVAGFIPCKLCWYQRIGMYPLSVILGIAALKRDAGIRRYVVPIALAAAAVSAYHYQLERFPGQTSFSCTADAPCTLVWVWQFHFISIPFMALSAFAAIATLLMLASRDRDGAQNPTAGDTSAQLERVGSR